MGQLGSHTTTAPAAPAPAPSPTATEVVTRPDPGLARGKWEAPPWLFWVLLAAIVLGAAAYVLRRLGVLKIKKAAKPDAASPTSQRAPHSGGSRGGPHSSRMRRP